MISIIFLALCYGLSAYSGFYNLGFHFIIICSFINYIGYYFYNPSLVHSVIKTGILEFSLYFIKVLITMAIPVGIVHVIAIFVASQL